MKSHGMKCAQEKVQVQVLIMIDEYIWLIINAVPIHHSIDPKYYIN